jgi:hypothetical protein
MHVKVSELEVKYVFSRNIFGPRYVEKYGRGFFLKAPGWKVEELEDGSILYIPEPRPLSSISSLFSLVHDLVCS